MTQTEVTVRFWAAARAAAGLESDRYPAATLAQVLAAAGRRHPDLVEVLPRCSYLLDGAAVSAVTAADRQLAPGSTLEVLPPFAGG